MRSSYEYCSLFPSFLKYRAILLCCYFGEVVHLAHWCVMYSTSLRFFFEIVQLSDNKTSVETTIDARGIRILGQCPGTNRWSVFRPCSFGYAEIFEGLVNLVWLSQNESYYPLSSQYWLKGNLEHRFPLRAFLVSSMCYRFLVGLVLPGSNHPWIERPLPINRRDRYVDQWLLELEFIIPLFF